MKSGRSVGSVGSVCCSVGRVSVVQLVECLVQLVECLWFSW